MEKEMQTTKSLESTDKKQNNTLLKNQETTEEIKEEIKKYLETNDNENTMIQNLWDAAKQFSEGSLQLYKPTSRNKKISNKQSNLTAKGTRERRTNRTQSQQKERNHKDQSRNK